MTVVNEIKAYGCHDVLALDGASSSKHLDYLDLLKTSSDAELRVDAIAEFQARPLLYIVSKNQSKDISTEEIRLLQKLLANRGERAYLGILSPGELNVYPINLDASALVSSGYETIKQESPSAPLFFQSVASGVFEIKGQPEEPDYVFNTIHDLLSKSSKVLIKRHNLNPLDVLSFLGRALFLRFLWDRKIVLPDELTSISPGIKSLSECFCNVSNSVATCQWLDETFNGDLLPLSEDYSVVFAKAEEQTEGKLFDHLQAILKSWELVGDEEFQFTIDWGDLDFAHIPIGVLSQVYENFSRVWDSHQAEQTSVYYTPKNIARYLVDDAFEGLTDKKNARILDPSCGAGIFLVLAFRKLVAARWELDGKRPGTKAIQDILYKQVCGFDVSESALRLAALSLYITAIELNDSPRPPKSLKFPKPLKNIALYNHRRPEEEDDNDFVLGSLRPDLADSFTGRFDMVIGNPPWSRLQGKSEEGKKKVRKHVAEFTRLTREVLTERGLKNIADKYKNPDNNPDLPFLWKSTQWVKPGGLIAMALPGRIFLKQTESGTRAFNAILQGLEVTGILNGSNLSDSDVWPGMGQAFMLLFARNRIPNSNHQFHFVTPHFERRLNDKGRIRIDYQSAQPIPIDDVFAEPHLLKAIAVGTILDAEILRKLDALKWPTVKSYWKSKKLYSGRGYDLSPNQEQKDASFMRKLPEFTTPEKGCFTIKMSTLPKFEDSTAHRTRDPELYEPPLLIIPQSPGASSSTAKSFVLHEPTVFCQSYYGFSAYGHRNIVPIALLHLITHSELFHHHVLMTSSRMGAERRTFIKYNVENFPFPQIDDLSQQLINRAEELSHLLETAPDKPWQEINDFIFDLYGLDKYDRQVVRDTLEVAQPYKEERDRANKFPSRVERDTFYSELQGLLSPYFKITGEEVEIYEIALEQQDYLSPWHFFAVSTSSELKRLNPTTQEQLISQIIKKANETGCSRVIVHEMGLLLIGIIGQYRYWTPTRARMCAMEIQRRHLDAFPIGSK